MLHCKLQNSCVFRIKQETKDILSTVGCFSGCLQAPKSIGLVSVAINSYQQKAWDMLVCSPNASYKFSMLSELQPCPTYSNQFLNAIATLYNIPKAVTPDTCFKVQAKCP